MKQPRLELVKTLAEPIGKKAVSELVVQRILDLVKSGHLSAGDKLPSERDLAGQAPGRVQTLPTGMFSSGWDDDWVSFVPSVSRDES